MRSSASQQCATSSCSRGRASDTLEEREDALREELRGALVVARQAAVREVVLVPRVEEELRVLGRRDELARRVDVSLVDEERVGVRAVDLHGHSLGPRLPELRDG